jgi:protease IV
VGFAAKAWRLLVAIKDGLVLVFMLLFFGALYALLSATPNPAGGDDGALYIALDGSLVEQRQAVDPTALLTGALPASGEYQVRDIVHALDTAVTDDAIRTVVLDLDGFLGGGQVAIGRVANAIEAVRKSGKPVLAFATGYSDDGYQLAAHASEIWLDPMGAALFTGPGGSQPYFKGLVDKLGVNARVYRVGKFKSFIEPYVLDKASPEAKAADQALADALWSTWQDDVSRARPNAKIAAFAADPAGALDASKRDFAKAALAAGLVDKLGDWTTFAARVAEASGEGADAPSGGFAHSTVESYLAANPRATGGDRIGVITVAGEIVDGEAPPGMAGGETVSRLILEALAEDELKALVVRVDSPGGSAFASEKIRLAILEARKAGLPVVVSMGNVAASGGYWVAMTGDKVFAEPATITGSIGVFGIIPTFENALPKAGISADGVATTPLSGQPDLLRGTNAATDTLIQAGIEDIYRRFTAMVAEKRKLPLATVEELAQGRVWDGGAARQKGLIDGFGSLDDAIAEAARRAKLDPAGIEIRYLEPRPSFLSGLIGGFAVKAADRPRARTDLFTAMVRREQAMLATGLAGGARILTGPAVQVRCIACAPSVPRRDWRSIFDLFTSGIFS